MAYTLGYRKPHDAKETRLNVGSFGLSSAFQQFNAAKNSLIMNPDTDQYGGHARLYDDGRLLAEYDAGPHLEHPSLKVYPILTNHDAERWIQQQTRHNSYYTPDQNLYEDDMLRSE